MPTSNRGQRVPLAYAKAVYWYRKAADQGQVYAQSNLGIMYQPAAECLGDYVQAYLWMDLTLTNER